MAKLALLVGVSEYPSGFKSLPAAVKDIEAMWRVLRNPEMGSFDDVKTLPNPDPTTMQEAIEDLFSGRAKDDLVLLFFSGHGVKDDNGRLHFATCITRKNKKGELVKSTAVPASFVQEMMNNSRCKRQVVLLDCCFSGAFAEGMTAKDDGSVDVKNQLGGEGRVVLTSATSTQYSFEQQESDLSVYTHYLVEGLETGDADANRDGWVGIDELHEYAKRKVQTAAPSMKPEIFVSKEGYKIFLSRVLSTDPIRRYRREVDRLASLHEITFAPQTWVDRLQDWLSMPPRDDIQISPARRKMLDAFRQNLGLSSEVASRIESETLQPYRELYIKLESYKQEVTKALRREKPLQSSTRRALKDLQNVLKIPDQLASGIEQEISRQLQKSSNSSANNLYKLAGANSLIMLASAGAFIIVAGFSAFLVQTIYNERQLGSREILVSASPIAVPSTYPEISPSSTVIPAVPRESSPSLDSNPTIQSQVDFLKQEGIAKYEEGNQLTRQEKKQIAYSSYQVAVDKFTQAINKQAESQAKDAALYLNRANAYTALGDKQNALKDYKEAIDLRPDDNKVLAWSYEGKGNILRDFFGTRDVKGASSDYEEAIRLYLAHNPPMRQDAERVQRELQKLQSGR